MLRANQHLHRDLRLPPRTLFVLELHQARQDGSLYLNSKDVRHTPRPSSQPHSSDKWVGLEFRDPQTYLDDFTQISGAISWASSEQLRKGHRAATQAWPTEPTSLPRTTATNTTWTTWTSCPWMRRSWEPINVSPELGKPADRRLGVGANGFSPFTYESWDITEKPEWDSELIDRREWRVYLLSSVISWKLASWETKPLWGQTTLVRQISR